MLKAIIFDMDGVIIDSHPIHRNAWRRFLASVGREVSDSDLDFVLDGRKKEDILRHFLGRLSDAEIIEYGHRKEELFREEALELKAVEGLDEFLAKLRQSGLLLAVASSGSKSRVKYVLDRLHLASYFHAIITGDDVPKGKPDPTIFRRAAHLLGCACSDVLVIEDAVSGVLAAKSAGMRCLGVASNGRGAALAKAGADHVVTNFVELPLPVLHNIGNGNRLQS